ncbi:MAG: VWA domain-containing protein [Chloroflexota bacterium]|nr:VWA domain-containing protein [Chloroflexota bacterium]MDQ5864183.1 VWA domain-containing protein [Chloroflexota bacterium]
MELPFSITEPRALILLLAVPPVVWLGVLTARARYRDRARIAASTVIRALILTFITLAIAGTQFIASGGPLNVVFLVDRSASVSEASKQASFDFVRHAIEAMGPDDRAAVVLFGENAILDRVLSADTAWTATGQEPSALATDIADAIQVGTALFPEGGAKRLVLLSDGVETVGEARSIAAGEALSGIQLSVVPLGGTAQNEVAVDRVVSPNSVPSGQQIPVRVLVRSNSDRAASVTLYDGETPVAKQDAALKAGDNVLTFTTEAREQGFHVLKARVDSVDDRFSENNEALSFTIVKRPPAVLIVSGTDADSLPLQNALEASAIDVDVVAPVGLPRETRNIGKYDAIVLANVSASSLEIEGQQVLQSYVRDMGRGLIMIGGDLSYGAGGYTRSPIEEVLPVRMDVRTSEERASLAMTFVLDKSGSMGRCHCGGNQEFNPNMRTEFGESKIELVKQAITKATSLLNSGDQVGVVTFDEQPTWLARLQPIAELGEQRLEQLLQPVEAQGNTDMFAALSQSVDSLEASNAQLKHIVVLGDGWSKHSDYDPLLERMSASNITLSTVGVGDGADELMHDLATRGGGRFYEAKDVTTVPDVLLKETIRLAGSYYVEEAFTPAVARASPILNGIDTGAMPPLLGYNASTIKPEADLILRSPRGDPLLAQWQYGLGRAVAWTPDAKGQWAADWVEWPQFGKFMGQMVGWTLPRQDSIGLEATFAARSDAGGRAQEVAVRVDTVTVTGAPRNFLPTSLVITDTAGISTTVEVSPRSPGVYDGVAHGLSPGAYAATVEQVNAETGELVERLETGFIVPYPSEYRLSGESAAGAQALMADLAQLGGGKVLEITQPASAFTHDISPEPRRLPMWPWLILASILLFPLDVAVRRVSLTPRELWRMLRGRAPENA